MGNAADDRLTDLRPHLRKPFGTPKDVTPRPSYGTKDELDVKPEEEQPER